MTSRTLVLAGVGATFIASGVFAQSTRTFVSQLVDREISDVLGPTIINIDVPDPPDGKDLISSIKSVTLLGFSHTWAGESRRASG